LEQIRPGSLPRFCSISSENAAHRIAVLWDDPSGESREGVFIPRRDTGSWLNHFAGGRIFPGEHHLADFAVTDDGSCISMSIRSRDGRMTVQLHAYESDSLPEFSCFESLAAASAYFEGGSVGYSVTRDCCRLDGIRLQTDGWQVRPLTVEHVESSFFADESAFPAGSVTFDHALMMRDLSHQWHGVADMFTERTANHALRERPLRRPFERSLGGLSKHREGGCPQPPDGRPTAAWESGAPWAGLDRLIRGAVETTITGGIRMPAEGNSPPSRFGPARGMRVLRPTVRPAGVRACRTP
jgi:hypothetical protein